MVLQYLGTAAAEGCPAMFCNCDNCLKARSLGGKNIRTRSQTIINDDLLIDFPADSYMHLLNNNLDFSKIKYLFFTHSHVDHFQFLDFTFRGSCYAHKIKSKKIKIFANEKIIKVASEYLQTMDRDVRNNIELVEVKAFEKVLLDGYVVTPLPARHASDENAFIYLIKNCDKTILYAHDTGMLYDENLKYFQDNKIYFNMISLDCTNTKLLFDMRCAHMGYNHITVLDKKLRQIGAIDDNTIKYVNHFSHNGEILQESIEKSVKPMGYQVAYDGRKVEI